MIGTLSRANFCIVFLAAGSAYGQTTVANGAGQLNGSIAIEYGSDNNVGTTNTNEVSDSFIRLSPSLSLTGRTRQGSFVLGYSGEFSEYSDTSSSSTNDSALTSEFRLPLSAKSGLQLRAETGTFSDGSDPDYSDTSYGATYAYGRSDAKMRIELSVDAAGRSYDGTTQGDDSSSTTVGGELSWQLAPKTRFVANASRKSISYDVTDAEDGAQSSFSGGLTWNALNKTSGSLKLGSTERSFDLAGKESISSGTVEGSVIWRPTTLATINLSVNQGLEDASSSDGFSNIESQTTSVSWMHSWTPLISSELGFSRTSEDYLGSSTASRNDVTTAWTGNADFSVTRRVSVRAGFTITDVDSSIPAEAEDYSQTVYTLGVVGKL